MNIDISHFLTSLFLDVNNFMNPSAISSNESTLIFLNYVDFISSHFLSQFSFEVHTSSNVAISFSIYSKSGFVPYDISNKSKANFIYSSLLLIIFIYSLYSFNIVKARSLSNPDAENGAFAKKCYLLSLVSLRNSSKCLNVSFLKYVLCFALLYETHSSISKNLFQASLNVERLS